MIGGRGCQACTRANRMAIRVGLMNKLRIVK
jgi:hypothetical protein